MARKSSRCAKEPQGSSAADRMCRLESQPAVRAAGDPVELVVKCQERLPWLQPARGGEALYDKLLQFRDALGLPGLVGEAHHQIVQSNTRRGPRRVSAGEAR